MATTTPESQQLRARATGLRRLSASLGSSRMLDLHRRAGDDVWLGPTAVQCRSDLLALAGRVTAASDDLVARARILERRAAELESIASAVAAAGAA